MTGPHVVVVGGGISGLTAAWETTRVLPGARVTVLDAADRPGGKLRREEVAGVPLDVGAESVLARRPEALELVEEVGGSALLTHPATTSASIWSRGGLHPLPAGSLMGVPSDPDAALGVLDTAEVTRAQDEQPWPGGPLERDVAVGEYVAARLGDAVVDRLVEPLLGGVYAGRARELSLQACVPALFTAAREGRSLTATARDAAAAARDRAAAPVFAGLTGGVGRLAELLLDRLDERGVGVRSRTIARELHRTAGGWRVVVGPRPAPEALDADAVVLAVPAAPAARLLRDTAPAAAAELSAIGYASMAIVTLAVEAPADPLPGSGFLVPPVDGRVVKASTFTSGKWAWAAEAGDGVVFLRASVGRAGESAELHREDADLAAVAVQEVGAALGRPLPRVADWHVQRWGGALPQYAVGHVDRVARIRSAVADLAGLELAGAAYDGVGIPACVGTGREAARAVTTHVRALRPPG